jgi:hypothetical protein
LCDFIFPFPNFLEIGLYWQAFFSVVNTTI